MQSPDTSRTWSIRDQRAMIAVAVQFGVNGAFFASFIPRLPELRDELDLSTRAIGLLLTVGSATGLIASATVRRVIAGLGTRRTLFVGGVLIAAALAVVGAATTWTVALLGLAVMFAFDVYVDVAMNMQGSWLSARRPRPVMNRLHGLWSLGSAVGGLVASQLAERSVSLTAHLCGAAVVLVAMSSIVATQLLPVDEVHADEPAPDAPDAWSVPPRSLFFAAGFTAVAIEMVSIGWAAFRLSDDLGGSGAAAALAYVGVVGGMTVARFGGDHLAHVLGPARHVRWSAMLSIAGLVAASVVRVDAVAVAAFAFAGLGIATLTPRLYDLAARAGAGSASGLGVLTAGMRTAALVTPAAVAALATATTVGTAIGVGAVLAGVGFLVSSRPFLADRRPPP